MTQVASKSYYVQCTYNHNDIQKQNFYLHTINLVINILMYVF